MEHGDIYSFEVQATCPYCTEQTDVFQDELAKGEVLCQHCDETFKVVLE